MDLKMLGTIIHNKRVEIGIPPSVLADRAGIRRPTLWIYERGENPKTGKPSRPSKDKLERIAEALHMNQEETEELFFLADYKVTNQPQAISDHILPIEQSGSLEQSSLSSGVSLAVADGTVYVANNGYLAAFDAKTGNRLWSSSTGISPLKSTQTSVTGRIENTKLSTTLNAIEQSRNDKSPATRKSATRDQPEKVQTPSKLRQRVNSTLGQNYPAMFLGPNFTIHAANLLLFWLLDKIDLSDPATFDKTEVLGMNIAEMSYLQFINPNSPDESGKDPISKLSDLLACVPVFSDFDIPISPIFRDEAQTIYAGYILAFRLRYNLPGEDPVMEEYNRLKNLPDLSYVQWQDQQPFQGKHAVEEKPEGLLFALSGIGGYENQDVLDELSKLEKDIFIPKMFTTRPLRKGESQGNPYVFLPKKAFETFQDAHLLLTYGLHPDRPDWYGHLAEPIMEELHAGRDVIMEAGPEEVVMLRRENPETIFILLNLIDSNEGIQTTTAEDQRWKNRFNGLEFNHIITFNRSLAPEAASKAAQDLRTIILVERRKTKERREAEDKSTVQKYHSNSFRDKKPLDTED